MLEPGSREGALLIGIIAKAGERRVRREEGQRAAVNKGPLCTGGPGTRPRHAALAPAGSKSQTNGDCLSWGRTGLGSRSQGFGWELGAAQGPLLPMGTVSLLQPGPLLGTGR